MRLPSLFRRENSDAAARERQEQAERALTQGLRILGDLLTRAADAVEKRRLERSGFQKQDKTLERVTPGSTKG